MTKKQIITLLTVLFVASLIVSFTMMIKGI